MCLGIPGRVIGLLDGYGGQLALLDVEGAERKVNIGMLEGEPLTPGDWVLIHMGFAVERVTPEGAREALAGLELVGRPRDDRPQRARMHYDIRGLVQGVGFRPFVYVLASDLGLAGSVSNTATGVIAEVEGDREAVEAFGMRLRNEAPPLAIIETVDAREVPLVAGTGFAIVASEAGSQGSLERRTFASPDVATCPDCLRELADPDDRRFRHPFITCTNCGPRFTIITDLPYDRPATTMAEFEMCAACQGEYDDPRDRRFHAQPIACPECGPELEFVDSSGSIRGNSDSLAMARYQLGNGEILAVKGIGGYHLVCDAEVPMAVAELRDRKQRGNKPFAVMVADVAMAREIVELNDADERLLTDPRRPIVLCRRKQGSMVRIADAVAPDTNELGVLLPYSPLHVLLFGFAGDSPGPRVLVMTSGNRGGEPIVVDDADARARLGSLVDGWLTHNRRIHQPCDDSVARVVNEHELPIRRSRGYAPMPLRLPFEVPPTLAVGADLKNTCAIASGRHVWMSQHIGDMDDVATVRAFDAAEQHLELLTGVTPEVIVADGHPGYRSSTWARRHADRHTVREVQHHHAHIASVMGEHGIERDTRVIGFAFDGTGYGPDGAIWGGEVLIADYKGFRRLAHLRYVPLAGGDASIERPYRMALSHLRAAGVEWTDDLPPVAACPEAERRVLAHQFVTGFGCVDTSSMGRLFDAVASLIGVRQNCDYEAQAAMMLEAIADDEPGVGNYRLLVMPAGRTQIIDTAPVIAAIADDVIRGVPPSRISSQFHSAVAAVIVELAERARFEEDLSSDPPIVVLGGGVFQNARLLSESSTGLRARGFTVLVPERLPPNDGGIALGQLLIASAQ